MFQGNDDARDLWAVLDELTAGGLKHLLCTDIGKDGAMQGPNAGLYDSIVERYPALKVQASGGVSGLRDLRRLSRTGADSAIVGKALYEGTVTVAALKDAARRAGADLTAHGADPQLPIALVQQGTTHKQKVYTGTLADIGEPWEGVLVTVEDVSVVAVSVLYR